MRTLSKSARSTTRSSSAKPQAESSPVNRATNMSPRYLGNQWQARSATASRRAAPILGVERQRRWSSAPLMSIEHAMEHDSGHALPGGMQREWGSRLGRDLSSLRVHADGLAARAVEASGANALNHGRDLFFAPGRYAPHSDAGRALIGHEIVHALQSEGSPSPDSVRVAQRQPALEAEADDVGTSLAHGAGPLASLKSAMQPQALRGDKRIAFSGSNITVTDTYVLYGDAASAAFRDRFERALTTYYNGRTFTYRGYTVTFNLSVRLANYETRTHFDMREGVESEYTVMSDSGWDSNTSLFEVESGSGRAGGIGTITLYETSNEGTIAHEVGHYLSDRVGYFSEGYTEGFLSRLGVGEGSTEIRPEAVMPDGTVDIMARSQTGVVTDFSLGNILDEAIDEHEAQLDREERERRFQRDLRAFERAMGGDPAAMEWFMRGLGGM